ncbi:MAG: chorismate synthase [Dysgonamonadaceae bacterium]|jgi:chorismate synthase|nr:chorismate synthase [Dysgonamonadaceae bacterium]
MNTWGNIFRLTSFGESHGTAVGGIIDGCPSNIILDMDFIRNELDRRKPGQSDITTSRKEPDRVEFLSGIYEGKTTGTPIAFMIRNSDQQSSDYDSLKNLFRPSHADYAYHIKYGHRDPRGGGRSSARETVARVVAGAIAKIILGEQGINITAYTSQVGPVCLGKPYTELDFNNIEKTPIRCPDLTIAGQMVDLIREVQAAGDTLGGVVSCVCKNVPAGLGDPVFGKLSASLANAMMSINAAKGFDYGMGFDGIHQRGSEVNDLFYRTASGATGIRTNHSGGIQGGISNGEDIYFRVAFKPVATLLQPQSTVDKDGNEAVVKATGRHDPCVLPRAVPVVEAMAAMTILDELLTLRPKRHSFFSR